MEMLVYLLNCCAFSEAIIQFIIQRYRIEQVLAQFVYLFFQLLFFCSLFVKFYGALRTVIFTSLPNGSALC